MASSTEGDAMNDGTEELLEVSRWQREAAAKVKIQAMGAVDEFEDGTGWGRFAAEEVARLIAIALFVAVILAWAAIL